MVEYIADNIITIVTGVAIGYLLYLLKQRRTEKCKEKELNEMQIERIANKLDELDKEVKSIKKTNRLNTQNNIMRSYDYYIRRESITPDERRHLIDMYEDHQANGGNGVVKKMMECLLEIPVKKEG